MTFQGREYIEYAEHLSSELQSLRDNNKEHLIQAAYRAISSRAYYGAFLEARIYLGLQDSNANSIHKLVCNEMESENRQTGNALSELKRLRVKADYNKRGDVIGRDISSAIRNAKNVLAYIVKQI